MKRNFEIELLAPAKDKECAITAIDCGADAVYIGAVDFGARKNAPNSVSDIKEIIDYAHKYRAKVFVTVNTLLFDNEIEQAKNLINELYKIQTDAVIIQDFGLLATDLPQIALHASTQCHNDTVEKVNFLEAVGFQRAILARELSLDEIRKISQSTSIELEAFVHGALCVSYSGQCYMSYAIGGRSANRGECAQPCRKKYSLIDANNQIIAKNQHLLCLKDFNASDYLEELINAGVSSFKIEGRLKDKNYIKNVVSFYRQELDKIIEKKGLKRASCGVSKIDFTPDLNKTFNRDYCSYFLNGRNKNITSFSTPKHKGELIGTVGQVGAHYFTLKGKTLQKNDGITFFDKNNILCGTKIEKIEQNRYFPNSMENIFVGTKIYRNLDYEFLKQVEKSIPVRKIPVKVSVNINDKTFRIDICDEENNISTLEIENNFEPAQNEQKARENLEKQLLKFGSTEFVVKSLNLKAERVPFLKINEINDMRRKLCEEFQKLRENNYKLKKQQQVNCPKYIKKELDYKNNITNEQAKSFYEKCGAKLLEYGAEHQTQSMSGKQVMETKHCLRYSFGLCKKTKQTKTVSEPLFLVDETGKKYKLDFDCRNCRMKIFF